MGRAKVVDEPPAVPEFCKMDIYSHEVGDQSLTHMGVVQGVPPDLAVPVNGASTIHVDVVAGQEPECRAVRHFSENLRSESRKKHTHSGR